MLTEVRFAIRKTDPVVRMRRKFMMWPICGVWPTRSRMDTYHTTR